MLSLATMAAELLINAGLDVMALFHTLVLANGRPAAPVKDDSAPAVGAISIAVDAMLTARVSAVQVFAPRPLVVMSNPLNCR